MSGESQQAEPLVGADLGELKEVKANEMALRFGFGALASIVAGVTSLVFGPHLGGLFLAFPAILPATLTLMEKKEGLSAAIHDTEGAVLGAVGLVVFAVVFEPALENTAIGWALLCAFAAWLATSVLLYLAVETIRRRRAR